MTAAKVAFTEYLYHFFIVLTPQLQKGLGRRQEILSTMLDLTHGKRNQGTAQGLQKSQGQGTGRKSALSFITPAPWPPTKHQQRSLALFKEQEAIFQGGETEAGKEEGTVFQMRLSILDGSISS